MSGAHAPLIAFEADGAQSNSYCPWWARRTRLLARCESGVGSERLRPRSAGSQEPCVPPNCLEAELLVEPVRPVVGIGDEEGEVVAGRV
jgi:hypothetical protein